MRRLNYTRCAVICHGLSEVHIARHIRSNLRLKIEIISKNNGHSSIQITSLMSFLSSDDFCKIKRFSEKYSIECVKRKLIDFKLFIIMDTDDCTEKQREQFLSKEMFLGHPLYDYIYPIANNPNIESVLIKSGKMDDKIKKAEKASYYLNNFPINNQPHTMDSVKAIKSFRDALKEADNSNMDEFLDYCLNLLE